MTLAILLIKQSKEIHALKNRINFLEDELFISDKDPYEDEDFIKAMASLDKEFPG
jgi:hypothetical protein